MKQKFIFLLIFLFFSVAGFSQDENFENKIRKFIEVTGGKKGFDTAINSMIDIQKNMLQTKNFFTMAEKFPK